jgi:uncharacterized lipoprotein YmbA
LKLINVLYFGFSMLVLSILVSGCSSTPSPTNYYLLNNQPSTQFASSDQHASESAALEKQNQVIVVSINDLPEYLEQPHLVMQMSDHQLHYANFHMWAEPLKEGLKKALLADLTSSGSASYFIAENRELKQANLTTLFVNVDFFHATANSKVVLSGQFWLSKPDEIEQLKSQSFYFELQLEKNGYPHSVEKMRVLVSKLADKIVTGI